MGAYSSNFAIDSSQVIKGIKPTNPRWILRHAEALDMPISETSRCWKRFLQLGGNKKGLLAHNGSFLQQNSQETDKFVQQIFLQLPWSPKGLMTFQVFLKVCKWFNDADEVTKLKVVYGILNRNRPLDVRILQQVLKHVYPDEPLESVTQMAENFIEHLDYKKQGSIDEEEFISFAKTIPFQEMRDLLFFQIFPDELNYNNSEE